MRPRPFVASLFALLALLFGPNATHAGPREDVVVDAAFAKGRLWLLSSRDALSSIAPRESRREGVALPGRVLGLCVRDSAPNVLVGQGLVSHDWDVYRLGAAGWSRAATMTSEALAWPVAMVCGPSGTTVLTRERLIRLAQGRQTSVALVGRQHKGKLRAIAAVGGRILIGRYAGEWGGGLDAIDENNGRIIAIDGTIPGRYCKTPLDARCDPVTGIAAEPWKPGCAVATIGLRHMSPTGRLVEVCGDAVTELYHKPFGSGAPYSSLPFNDVQRVGETLRAIADDGLYTIDRAGVRWTGPIPAVRDVDGVGLSFAVPGVVVVKPSPTSDPVLVAR